MRHIVLLLALVITGAPTARAESVVDRAYTSGLALGVGLGSEQPMIGGHLLYYHQLANPRLRVGFRAGGGARPPSAPGLSLSWGASGGCSLSFGRRHRLIAGLSAGAAQASWLNWYGTTVARRPIPGAWLDVGWEWMLRRGFYLRTTAAPALLFQREAPLRERELHVSFVSNVSLGWKLW